MLTLTVRIIHRPLPGDLLLQPVALVALAVVIVNDRWLKVHYPGVVSGKLSDFAGLVYFPLFVATLIEVLRWTLGRATGREHRWTASPTLVGVISIMTGTIFTLAKLVNWFADVYRTVFGIIWWPADAFSSIVAGNGWPPLGRLGLTEDPTDLVAVPCLVVPILISRQVAGARSESESATAGV